MAATGLSLSTGLAITGLSLATGLAITGLSLATGLAVTGLFSSAGAVGKRLLLLLLLAEFEPLTVVVSRSDELALLTGACVASESLVAAGLSSAVVPSAL